MKPNDKPPIASEPALTADQEAQLLASDAGVPDTDDIPEAPAQNWTRARIVRAPPKEAISIRLDADVLDWLKRSSDHYQSEINRILRARMDADTSS